LPLKRSAEVCLAGSWQLSKIHSSLDETFLSCQLFWHLRGTVSTPVRSTLL